jgi:hypothetical protein
MSEESLIVSSKTARAAIKNKTDEDLELPPSVPEKFSITKREIHHVRMETGTSGKGSPTLPLQKINPRNKNNK